MRRYLGYPLLLVLCCVGTVALASAPELPITIADEVWRPLERHGNSELQRQLDQHVRQHRGWRDLIRQKKFAIGLVDLADPAAPRFARVNGNVEMYAASLPKIAILLAAFDRLERGGLKWTKDLERDLNAMIRVSDNGAATRTIDRLGGLMAINKVLRDPRYRLYDPKKGGGLWVGKRYAKQGPRIPDPLHGISHAATVDQVCRFYYRLLTGRLINPQASAKMLTILSDPAIQHKFVKTLHDRVPAAKLYRKSGTWKTWHTDSVLVWGPVWRRYILVAMVESPKGERILRDLVQSVDNFLAPDEL